MNDIRNMKMICSLLHEISQDRGWPGYEIDDLIFTAERVYHEMKEAQ